MGPGVWVGQRCLDLGGSGVSAYPASRATLCPHCCSSSSSCVLGTCLCFVTAGFSTSESFFPSSRLPGGWSLPALSLFLSSPLLLCLHPIYLPLPLLLLPLPIPFLSLPLMPFCPLLPLALILLSLEFLDRLSVLQLKLASNSDPASASQLLGLWTDTCLSTHFLSFCLAPVSGPVWLSSFSDFVSVSLSLACPL